MDVAVRVDSVGISLIDDVPQEVIYLNGDKLELNVELTANEQKMTWTLDALQIDNGLPDAISPVLFVGKWVKQTKKPHEKFPWLKIKCDLFSTKGSGSKMVQTLEVRPQKFAISLDGGTLQKLMDFVYVFSASGRARGGDDRDGVNRRDEAQPMYFGQLFLAPMEMMVTFRDLDETLLARPRASDGTGKESGDGHTSGSGSGGAYGEMHGDGQDGYEEMRYCSNNNLRPLLQSKWSSSASAGSGDVSVPLLNDIMYQFGVVVVQFDSATIRVSGFSERDRVFDSRTLLNRLSSHYSGLSDLGFFVMDLFDCRLFCLIYAENA